MWACMWASVGMHVGECGVRRVGHVGMLSGVGSVASVVHVSRRWWTGVSLLGLRSAELESWCPRMREENDNDFASVL